jgi:hypothetical protein
MQVNAGPAERMMVRNEPLWGGIEGSEGKMSDGAKPSLSVMGLFAERDARRRKEKEAEGHLLRRKEEELAAFKKRLDDFQLTDDIIELFLGRIKRAFERGESELMLTAFPSSFCTDDGRAVINAGAPPINKPGKGAPEPAEPDWLATMPKGARPVYEYWKSNLKPGGFSLTARIINYPGGMPGDVGLFLSWPRDTTELQQ